MAHIPSVRGDGKIACARAWLGRVAQAQVGGDGAVRLEGVERDKLVCALQGEGSAVDMPCKGDRVVAASQGARRVLQHALLVRQHALWAVPPAMDGVWTCQHEHEHEQHAWNMMLTMRCMHVHLASACYVLLSVTEDADAHLHLQECRCIHGVICRQEGTCPWIQWQALRSACGTGGCDGGAYVFPSQRAKSTVSETSKTLPGAKNTLVPLAAQSHSCQLSKMCVGLGVCATSSHAPRAT